MYNYSILILLIQVINNNYKIKKHKIDLYNKINIIIK